MIYVHPHLEQHSLQRLNLGSSPDVDQLMNVHKKDIFIYNGVTATKNTIETLMAK